MKSVSRSRASLGALLAGPDAERDVRIHGGALEREAVPRGLLAMSECAELGTRIDESEQLLETVGRGRRHELAARLRQLRRGELQQRRQLRPRLHELLFEEADFVARTIRFDLSDIRLEPRVLPGPEALLYDRSRVLRELHDPSLGIDAGLQRKDREKAARHLGAHLATELGDLLAIGGERLLRLLAPVALLAGNLERLRDSDQVLALPRLVGDGPASDFACQRRVVPEQRARIGELPFERRRLGLRRPEAGVGLLRAAERIVERERLRARR